MKTRELNAAKRRKWQSWARHSLGSRLNSRLVPFRLEVPYTIHACQLEGLKGRLVINRETEEPLFLVHFPEGVSACHLHGHVRGPRPNSRTDCQKREQDVLNAGRDGRVWWGVERLSDPAWHTAILYVAPP
jgi:hypothetical protein